MLQNRNQMHDSPVIPKIATSVFGITEANFQGTQGTNSPGFRQEENQPEGKSKKTLFIWLAVGVVAGAAITTLFVKKTKTKKRKK